MPNVQYSALVNGMAGKLSGSTLQTGLSGNILRSSKNWNRTQSTYFNKCKCNMASISTLWQTLTPQEAASWRTATGYGFYKIKGNLPIQISGYHLFVRCNMNLTTAGIAPIRACPIIPTFENVYIATFGYTSGTLDLYFNAPVTDASNAVQFWMPPASRYNALVPESQFRVVAANEGYGNIAFGLHVFYIARYADPVPGAQYYVAFRQININSGLTSAWCVATCQG